MRRNPIYIPCLFLLIGILACTTGTILPTPLITAKTTLPNTSVPTVTPTPPLPKSTPIIESTKLASQTPGNADSPLVLPVGWAVFSSDTLGFSVWYPEGALVFELDDSVSFLVQEGIIEVMRLRLASGQTIQDIAEAFVLKLEEPLRSMTVPPAEPLNIPGHEAYSWQLSKYFLLARVQNDDIGLVYIGFDYTDSDYLQNVILPFALQTLGSFRFLEP